MENKDPNTKGRTRVGAFVVLFVAVAAIIGAVALDKGNMNQMKVGKDENGSKILLGEEMSSNENGQIKSTEDVTDTDHADQDQTKESGQSEASGAESSAVAAAVEKAGLNFDENSKILWPVEGQVLIPYSMDTTTYFSTLNEYKVNDAVMLQADKDMKVTCGATGVVSRTGKNEEVGNFVVLDVGNNYHVTYGNLNESDWKIGQVIEKGKSVGTIADPTKYYSKEGYNLYLRMDKAGESVDPLNYLDYEEQAAAAFTQDESEKADTTTTDQESSTNDSETTTENSEENTEATTMNTTN